MPRPATPFLSALAAAVSAALALLVPDPTRAADAAGAEAAALHAEVDRRAAAVTDRVVAWRRDLHQHPELSNREHRTAARVAEHLESLGLAVRRGVAHTGVLGVLEGGRPGPTVALRADMDALPVTEEVDVPFRSTLRTEYLGREVGVMHACGHDAHVAISMGAAEVLAGLRERLPGRVLFVFQPAEEGAPPGEEGGAELMLAEGAFADPRPGAVFGLHVVPQHEVGEIAVRPGGVMAGSDRMRIAVRGTQTHAAYPWLGVDPIAVAAQLVPALLAIPGRQLDARTPAVVSVGAIHGGVRHNIIPDEVELLGTIRHLDPAQQGDLHERIRRTASRLAEASGASAEVEIDVGYPVTVNDPELVARMRPTLARVAGAERVVPGVPRTGAEDFSFFAREVPGVYFWLGIRPPGVPEADAASNHSPRFTVDEAALPLGVRAMASLAVDWLLGEASQAGAPTAPDGVETPAPGPR